MVWDSVISSNNVRTMIDIPPAMLNEAYKKQLSAVVDNMHQRHIRIQLEQALLAGDEAIKAELERRIAELEKPKGE